MNGYHNWFLITNFCTNKKRSLSFTRKCYGYTWYYEFSFSWNGNQAETTRLSVKYLAWYGLLWWGIWHPLSVLEIIELRMKAARDSQNVIPQQDACSSLTMMEVDLEIYCPCATLTCWWSRQLTWGGLVDGNKICLREILAEQVLFTFVVHGKNSLWKESKFCEMST